MKFSFYTYTLVKMEGLGHGGRLIHMKDRSSSKFMHPEQPCTATGDFCSAIHVEILASVIIHSGKTPCAEGPQGREE